MKNIMLWIAALGTAALVACTPAAEKRATPGTTQQTGTGTVLVGSVHLSLYSGSNLIYSDRDPSTFFRLTAGVTYTLRIDASEAAGATLTAELLNISVPGPVTPISVPITLPDTTFTVSSQGTYTLTIRVAASGMTERVQQYQLEASCQNPTFTAASLNPNAITVTRGSGSNNLFNYSAAGVAANANGQAPYQYAWDPTGVGIRHTNFSLQPTLNDFYSDLVGSRNVGLIVKDACNTAHNVAAVRTLQWTPPPTRGVPFIEGTTASGAEDPDERFRNVDYLATNQPGNVLVDGQYGGGTMVCESALQYDMPGAVSHGVRIEIRGLIETVPLDPATMAGQISLPASPSIYRLTFTTDKDGDARPPVSLTGNNCQWTNPGVEVIPTMGTPCADNSGTNNELAVEVWGNFRCDGMTGDPDSLTTFQGRFSCSWTIADGCVGGQGQGQGGIFPINF